MSRRKIIVPDFRNDGTSDLRTVTESGEYAYERVIKVERPDECGEYNIKRDTTEAMSGVRPTNNVNRIEPPSKCCQMGNAPQPDRSILSNRLMPAHSMPWVYEFPEIFEFYMANTPDFTGIGLYRDTLYTTEFRSSAARNPLNFTLQALVAERVRWHGRRPEEQLRRLKSHALAMINQALSDPSQQTSIDVISSVGALVLFDMTFDPEYGNAAAHLVGLKRLVDLKGGLENIEPFRTRMMIAFVDSVYGYLHRTTPLFLYSATSADRYAIRTDNPIRLALQPTHSKIPSWRLNNHLMISYGAPIAYLLRALAELQQLANALLQPPYSIGPDQARHEIARLHFNFMKVGAAQGSSQLPTPEFAAIDCLRHDQTVDAARLVGMVLLARLNIHLKYTSENAPELDFHIQRLLIVILDPQCVMDLPMLCWCLATGTSLLEDGPQRNACIPLIGDASSKLGLNSWEAMEAFLSDIFYCPVLQAGLSYRLWRDIDKYRWEYRQIDV